MYFEIEGSNVRLAGTMHCVPRGRPLAHWVHDAISWARVIYVEHDREESERGRYAPPGSQALALRMPHSWPRIERTFPRQQVAHLAMLRPCAVASDVLYPPPPIDPGVERLAIARSKETQPPGPRIQYLETAAQSYAPADCVSDAVWDVAVSWALDNPESYKNVLETSYSAWIAGDFEEVERISTLHWLNRFAPIKHAVITARNYLWLPTIRELVQSAREPTLVLVGVAHLGGADGLLPQLAAGGLMLTGLDHQALI
jgi:uncharacterized protein YbaP (TraB family)